MFSDPLVLSCIGWSPLSKFRRDQMSAEMRASPWTSLNIKFSLDCFYIHALRITNLFHATKWLCMYTFTFPWYHVIHTELLLDDVICCTRSLFATTEVPKSAKSFLCFSSSSSSSVVLDFHRTLFLLSPYSFSPRSFHEV